MSQETDHSILIRQEAEMTKTYRAPRQLVFEAWTEPEHLAQWWGPSGISTPMPTITIEPRPGGAFDMTMVSEETGDEYPAPMVIRDIEPPHLLVYEWGEHDDREKGSGVVSVDFKEDGDHTELLLVTMITASQAMLDGGRIGMGQSLDKLDEYLTRIQNNAS